jgi:hypothetical protein
MILVESNPKSILEDDYLDLILFHERIKPEADVDQVASIYVTAEINCYAVWFETYKRQLVLLHYEYLTSAGRDRALKKGEELSKRSEEELTAMVERLKR